MRRAERLQNAYPTRLTCRVRVCRVIHLVDVSLSYSSAANADYENPKGNLMRWRTCDVEGTISTGQLQRRDTAEVSRQLTDRQEERFTWLAKTVSQLGVFIAGVDFYVMTGGSLTLFFTIAFLPVCLGGLHVYKTARLLISAIIATLTWGILLAFYSNADHWVNTHNMQIFIGKILTGACAFMLVIWARRHVPLERISVLFGLGFFVKAALRGDFTWKFGLANPVTFIVLGLCSSIKNKVAQGAITLGLGIFGMATGARSYFAFCFVTALMYMWQNATATKGSETGESTMHRWRPALLMAVLGLVVYFGASSLMTSGALGKSLQQRSTKQIEAAGSLIGGGRPEWAATKELMKRQPHGFGIGVVPTWGDLRAGASGLASINVFAGGPTKDYMFGGAFELHSGLSDYWVNAGFVGIGLTFLILFILIRNVSALLAERRAATFVIFAVNLALWSMLFGPLYTDWLPICIALGLSMLPAEAHHTEKQDTSSKALSR